MQFPKGATALDFALSIHTDLGIHCIGCKINGKVMPIDTPLKSGSTVEILRSENQRPNMDWLRYVRTSKAKSALKRWLSQEGKIKSKDLGIDILRREFKKVRAKISFEDWVTWIAKAKKIGSTEKLEEMVGSGELSSYQMHTMAPEQNGNKGFSVMSRFSEKKKESSKTSAILINSDENVIIRFARCCMPVPGEKIVGFLTSGRGVSIHKMNCANVVSLADDNERQVAVDWNTKERTFFKARVEVISKDRINLLNEFTQIISSNNANIVNANIVTRENVVHDIFIIEVIHLRQLKKILSLLRKVKGVQRIVRGRMEENKTLE